MSCNYLNAELFLLSFLLCLLPLSMVRLSFSLCLSISHMCFLCLFSLFPDSPPSLTFCLCHLSFCLSLVPVPLSASLPHPSWPRFKSCRGLGKGWGKRVKTLPSTAKTPSSKPSREGEGSLPSQLPQPGSGEYFPRGLPECQSCLQNLHK